MRLWTTQNVVVTTPVAVALGQTPLRGIAVGLASRRHPCAPVVRQAREYAVACTLGEAERRPMTALGLS
jgi:hypothetical protein